MNTFFTVTLEQETTLEDFCCAYVSEELGKRLGNIIGEVEYEFPDIEEDFESDLEDLFGMSLDGWESLDGDDLMDSMYSKDFEKLIEEYEGRIEKAHEEEEEEEK